MFSEGSKPTLCKPERSVTVPRIHPQSVPLKSPTKGLWEPVWMDSKQKKTHLITSFIMNLGFFRAGDITLLWNVGKEGGCYLCPTHTWTWHVLQASPLTSHKTLSSFRLCELDSKAAPALLPFQRWLVTKDRFLWFFKGSFIYHITA